MNLFIARHGQSYGNIGQCKSMDPGLTPLGCEQARLLGERLAAVRFDCIISSSMIRTLATANAVAIRQPGGPAPVEVLPDLMEQGTDPEYRPCCEEMLQYCPTAQMYTIPTAAGGDGTPVINEVKGTPQYMERADRVIAYLRRRFNDFSGEENVLLVTHGGFANPLVYSAAGITPALHFLIRHTNTGLTRIQYALINDRPVARIFFLNDIAHLFKAGLGDNFT